EKVTFGHLDVCEDPVAKEFSDEAKKLIQSRPETSKRREYDPTRQQPTVEGAAGGQGDESCRLNDLDEQDREIGESVETNHIRNIDPSGASPKKDAQVQTP